MARIRSLKPDFFQDRTIAALGPVPALIYEALWCLADDTGVAPADADRVKGELFFAWESITLEAVAEALDALERAGRISRYVVDQDAYAEIPTFLKHQVINRPSSKQYPRRGLREPSVSPPRADIEPSSGEVEVEVELGSGAGKGKALVELRSTQTPATSGVELRTQERVTRERALAAGAEVVFAYWKARLGKNGRTVLDRKRESRIVARLRENGGDVAELLYAIDGALRDDYLMGRDPKAPRAYDGVETIFRDRAQVERLASTVPQRAERHPFLEQPQEEPHVSVA